MGKVMTIARRELGTFFASPMFWVLTAAFLAFFGWVFQFWVTQGGGGPGQPGEAEMGPLLGLIGTILLFVTPLLAMRLLAEEQRAGTLELLMTSPVRDWHVVTGKWLAAFVALVAMLATTLLHVGVMFSLATNGMALGPLAASYLGLLLLGAALMALGVLTSALTESQVIAGFLGIMLVMILWFLPVMSGGDGTLSAALSYLGMSDHYLNFGQGVVDTRDVVYFVSLTVGALYLATRILETRRWR